MFKIGPSPLWAGLWPEMPLHEQFQLPWRSANTRSADWFLQPTLHSLIDVFDCCIALVTAVACDMYCKVHMSSMKYIRLDQSWLCKHLLQELDKLIGLHIMISGTRLSEIAFSPEILRMSEFMTSEMQAPWMTCKHHHFHSDLAFPSGSSFDWFLMGFFFVSFVL